MSKITKASKIVTRKPEAGKGPQRRTRMIALEPRMLFDGALGVDLGAKATAVVLGDASQAAPADAITPATPEPTRDASAAAPKDSSTAVVAAAQAAQSASATPAEKDALQKPGAEALDATTKPAEPKEIVFVDSRVKDYQSQLAGVDPKATIVFLDASKDGVTQIADAMANYSDVTAVHIIAQGSADQLLLGSGTLDAASMTGLNAQRIASISEHITADAKILVHGDADFGKGAAGGAAADRLALLTSADVADVAKDGTVESVGTPARQEIVFVDPTVRDYEKLIEGIDSPNARVVLIDSTRDGVQQIADVVKQYTRVDAIHIISHGSEGQIDIGSGALNSITMQSTYAAQLADIGKHMSADADLLVYGCNFGKGADGADAANKLAGLTGTDVEASTDDTGHVSLNGNWTLEYATGKVETNVIVDRQAQDAWQDKLAVYTLDWDTLTWPSGSTQTYNVGNGTVGITTTTAAPVISNTLYTGGYTPAQNSLVFTTPTTSPYSMTVTIDFTGQTGGSVSNVGFALFDVDNTENCVVTGWQGATQIAPTNVATSSTNSAVIGPTSATVTGNGGTSGATNPNGNVYFYFNTNNLTRVTFTYSDVASRDVVLNDITFMGNKLNPPVVDLDSTAGVTGTASDGFTAATYTNASGGTIPWAGNWVESDSSGAAQSAGAGNIRVVDTPTTGTDYGLRLNNSTTAGSFNGASRAINLAGYSSLSLTYDYITSAGLNAADQVVLEVSTNGGTNWSMLKTYAGSSASATTYTNETVSLAGYESANTVIRFRVAGPTAYTGAAEYFYVDNLTITAQGTDSSNAYTEGDAVGVKIAATSNSLITDPDSASMSSGNVTINSVVAGDTLTFTNVGSLTGSYNSGTGVLTISGTDTKANYQAFINSIRYKSTSDDPTVGGTRTTRSVDVYVFDTGANQSNTATSTITITDVNDAPTTTATALNPTFQEAAGAGTQAAAVNLFSGAAVATIESGQTITELDLTVTGIADGANERVRVDGTNITLGANSTGTTATNGMTYTVTVSGGTATIVLTKVAGVSAANTQTLINGITYQDTSTDNPTPGSRVVTLTQVKDSGGTAGGGADTTALSIASTVNVVAVNDAPAGADKTFTISNNATYTLTAADFGFTDVDGNSLQSVIITTIPTAPATVKNNGVTLTAGATVTLADIVSGKVQYVADTNNRTFTFQVVDDGGTASSGQNTDQSANTFTFNTTAPANTAPVFSGAASNFTTITEDQTATAGQTVGVIMGAVTDTVGISKGIALTTTAQTNGTWQYSLDGGGSWTSVPAVTGTTALLLRDTDLLRFVPNAQNAGSGSLTYRAWDQTSGIAGTQVNPGVGGGTTAFSVTADTHTSTITTTALNDAPTLDATKTPVLTAVNEDAGAPVGAVGTLVSALVDFAAPAGQVDNVADVDSVASLGIAITAADTTNGTWYYSTNNGGAWTALGAVTNTTARLLAADVNTRVYFRPAADYNGTVANAITFRAWDQTSGANGGTADTSTNGGTTAFSTATDTANIVVNSVNDAPVNTVPGAQTVNEDTSLSISGVSINDVDGNISTTRLTVTNGTLNVSLAGGATISAGANNSSTLTLSGTQAQINTALASLAYQGNLNFNGADTLTVLSTDASAATDSDTVNITVNSVNDAPVNTVPGAQTVNEDTALSISGISVNDVDGNLSTTRLTVASGTLNVSLAGGATISSGANNSATLTLSGTQAQINAALASLSYTGNLNFNGADTLTVLSTDASAVTDSDTVAITVNAVNDAPVNAVPGAQTVNEDTALSISGLSVNDVDGNLSTTRLTVSSGTLNVSLAGGATISAGANNSTTLTLSGTQAQINAALASLSYQGNLNFNGADTLTVLSTDSNAVTDSDTVAITVNAVNDVPVNTVPGAQSVNEDTALSISGISVNDVDGNLSTTRLTVTNGRVTVSLAGGATISSGANNSSTLTLSGTQAQINAALASLSYQGNLNFNGSDTLTVLSTDASAATDSDTVAITVNAVNDAPVNTVPGAQTVNEDTSLSIAGISVNDVDGNLSTTRLTVTSGTLNVSLVGGATISSGANGSATLTLSGTQAQINAALATLSYQGSLNFNGSDTLTVLSTDSNAVTDSDTVAITVSSVNDVPVNTVPGAQTVNEDTALSIAGISVNDVDGNLSTTRLTVTNGALNVSLAGGATISSGANNSATLTLSGTQAQINAALASLSYTGNLNFNGSDTLTVLSTDASAATDSDTVAITVNAVNDAPVNTVPGAQAVNEDTALSISGLSVNDVDGNLSTTRLTVTNGRVTVSLAGGATISAGANNSTTLTLSGTQAQINAALASLSYQGSLNFNGSDTLTVLSTDSNAVTDSDTVAITVNSVNDLPVNTVPGAQTVNEDTSLSISGISVNDVDGNLSTTRLTVTGGTLNVSLAGGATISAGANNSATLTLSGTQAQINAALASVSYQGSLNFNGSDTLTVLSTDSNAATDSDTVAITVNAVNDAPVNAVPGAQTVNEDTALSISGLSVNDVDGNLSTTRLTVTNGTLNVSLAGGATISSGANGSATLTLSGTQAQINAALASVSYQGSLNFNGSDTLTVLSTDSNAVTDSDTVAITVNAVNDAPVNTVPGAQTVNEDTALSIAGISVNDVDGNLSTTRLTVSSGTLNVSLAGGATISSGANGSSTLTLSGTQAQINAALASLSYQGALNFNGSDTLTVLSTDSNAVTDSDTVAITVNSVNDVPVNTVPGAQTVNEDTALSISGISVNDVDGNLSTTRLTVTNGRVTVSLAGGATISAGANNSSTLTLSGTQAQINSALTSLSYTGNLNFNGSDTLTVLSTDASAATDSDTVAITVNAVNDAPVNTVPGAQTVNEDTSLSIAGISVNDVDGNLSTTRVTVTNGTLNVSLAGGATISSGANNSATLTLSGTQAQINAALASLSYQGSLNFNGSDTLTVLSTDSNAVTDSDTVAITVSSVNDAPVNTVPGAQTVNEDTALSISGLSVVDVDGNLSTTRLTVTSGTLNVSLAGGATISSGANNSSTLTLAGTQAQINAALASVSYQGNLNFNGSDTLTVLSTDSNAVTDSDTVAITVSSVNDLPVNTVPGAQTVNEDSSLAISGISVNDVDGNLSTTRLTVSSGVVNVSLVGGATISSGANGSATLTLSGTQAQINAALATVTYQGGLNFNGSDTLTVLSTDANGATDSDAVAITVSSVNDLPVNTVPGAQTVNEDSSLAISGISVNDVDGNLSTTRVTVANGTLNVSLAGGATISSGANGSATLTLSGTQTQINAALASLSYQGSLNFNGSDTLTVLSTDSNAATDTDTVAITVNPVNDAPVNTVPGAQTVNEDTSLSISGLNVVDVDGNLSTTRLTVTNGTLNVSLVGGATISSGANGSSTLTLSGTQAQINAALASLSYQGSLNFNGSDTLTVLSTDSNAVTDSDTVAITVSAVNDAPVNTVPGAQTVNEDTSLSISGVSVVDVDGNLSTTRLTVTNGTLNVSLVGGATISSGANGSSTLTLSGTQAQINAALASLSYQGNLNFNGSDTLTVLSTDSNAVTDSDTVAITVSAVNDAPVNTVPGAQTVNEDTSLSISGVSVNDVDGNLSTTRLTVTNGRVTVSLAGGATISSGANNSSTLTLSGTQAQINAALASVSYQGNLNFNGSDTLTVLSTDSSAVTDSDTVAITVSSVNDVPVNTVPGAQTVNEDTSLSIAGISVNDVDGNLSTTRVTVTSGTLNVSLVGGATISSGANGSATLTLSGTQAQINAALASLSYQGSLNFNGSDTLTVLSTDSNGATDSDTVAITVSSVNDVPVNTVPGAQTVNEDTSLSIAGISVNDVDGNLSTTRVTVTSGTLNVSLAGGATISSGANGSATLTLSGTQAQINAALASLSYQGSLNFNGSDTLTVLSTDSNGATDSDAVAITVSSVNDVPVNTVPGAQTVNEDTSLSIAGISVNDVDGNLSTTRVTVTNGALNVSLAGGATISTGANGSATLTLSGTQAQINAALASLSYQGSLNFNGSDTLTVLSTDSNGATDSDTVAITVSSVNDVPVNTVPGAQTVNEDTSLSIAGISVNDVDGNLSTTRVTVTSGALNVSLAGGATISSGANNSATLTLSGTQAQINAALASLSYQGSLNFNGSDTLTVLSTDANGATDSDAVAITVSSVNDVPVNTVPGAQTVNEDTSLSIAGISVNDVDGNLSTTRVTVTSGTLNVSLAGGATISSGANGSSTLTLSGTQAQINAALASLSYQGSLNFNGSDTLTVLSTDANGATDSDTVAITVSSVNDAPVNTVPGAQTVNEDTSLSISGISVSDVDGNLSTTRVTVTNGALNVSLVGGATISSGANGSSTLTLSGTQAQINAALSSLSYQGSLNFNGSDTLTVLSTDANGATDSDAVAITVSSVNDVPVNTVPGAQTVNEDTSLSIAGISVNDVDGNLSTTRLTVSSGTLNVSVAGGATISSGANGSSTLTLSGTQAQINAALSSLSYQGSLNFNGSDTLTVLSTDANGATDSDAVAITVNPVNDAPVNTVPGAQTVNEDTSLSISGISVTDVDGNLSTTRLTVSNGALNVSLAGGATISSGANGSSTLTLSGTQAQINAALASLSYQGNLNFNGSDTLAVLSTDSNAVTDSDTVAITVNAVNDVPVNTVPGAQAVNEDAALSIGGISVNDVDGNLSTTRVTVTSGTLNVSLAGGATVSSGANGSSTLTLSGTQAQINAALASLSYQGNLNFNGSDTLTVLSTDANGATDSDTVAITVNSVNDVPVNAVPGAQTVNEDTTLSVAGISVNDVDGNLSTTRVTVGSGTLNVSLAGGATISSGGNNSSTLTLSGTQAQINAALASLSYHGNLNFNGSDTLTVLSTDANGATDSDTVAITVSAVNDAPSGANATVAILENSTYTFAATDFGFSDPDAGDTLTAVRIDIVPAAGTLILAGSGPVAAGQVISRADIDAGKLQYTPALNGSGAGYATVDFSVSDGTLFDVAPNTVTIDVGWVNHTPTITSGTAVAVGEGIAASTIIYTGTAVDLDVGDTITWSLTGADAGAFTVNAATGEVTFNASPDYETKSSYSFNVVASDGTISSSQGVTVTVTDVAPSITSATSVSVAEGTGTATVIYTAAANDPAGGAVSFTLSGADAAAFTINAGTGAVTFNASPDYETKSSYSFNVVASDGTLTSSQAVTVSVTDVAPSITSATSVSVPEGTASSTVVYTAAATDVAGGAVSFTLSGADAAAFTINAGTGAVTFNASPDYETKSSYSFNVVASDGTLTSSQAVTVSVTDVAPTITSATTVSVAEGTATSTVIYTAAANDPAGGAVSFTLSGADAAAFTVNAATGQVTFNASPDYETKSAYSFNVVASDGTLSSSQAVTVSITDVAPTITSATSVSVAEGTGTATVIYTAAANDPAGGAVSFTLSGADAAAFTINAATGQVTFNASPDYETKSSYSFNVVASDGTVSSNQAVTVSITDLAPTITSATAVSVVEGTGTATVIYTAAATDVQGGAVSFTLSGADAAAFTINAATGQVTFNASPDYETQNGYTFNIVASDGTLTSSQAVTVSITDLAPAITSATSVSVPEGTSTAAVVYTASAVDPVGGAISFSLTGADAAAFTINASTGAVTFNASPDYETKSSYSFNVVASDGTLSSSQAVTVSVTDVAPTVTSATAVSVLEGTSTATVFYTATATDPAGGAVSFTLSGVDAAAFTVNAATGEVTFNASPDYETKSSYSFNVVASDGTISSSQGVTVTVTDVAPSITSATSVSVAEGTGTATVIYTAAANDPAGGAVSFTLSGADAAAFTINAGTGAVTFNASPDYETKSSYSFNVVASDGTLTSSQAVTVSVTDVAPSITSATSVSVPEGTASSTVVYTAAATDVAGGAVSFTLSGADAAAFTINAGTGAVTFNASPDYETKSSYSFNVVASDGTLTSSQAVTVSVTDVAPTITSATTVSVAEGTATSTVIYTAAANDPAGGAVSFTLSGADAAAFTVNAATGQVTFNASPDYETKSAYSFNVVASDGTLSSSQAVTVSITDVAPTITSATSVSVAEGTGTATVIYTAAANDPAGGAVSFTLSGADAAAFTINAATGQVTFNASPDYETKSSYSFNVVASDGTVSSNQAVTVSITDLAPTITSATAVSVVEGTGTATVIYTAAATDVQGGAVSFTLSGADAAAFTINAATGQVTFNASPDFETKSAYTFNVVASDGTTSSNQAVTVSITNVNEAPMVTSPAAGSFTENTTGTVYTGTASDVDAGDTVVWTLSGPDAALFAVNPATGAVTVLAPHSVATPGDANADGVYDITVTATDSGGLATSRPVQLTLSPTAVPTPPAPVTSAPVVPDPVRFEDGVVARPPATPVPPTAPLPAGTPAGGPTLGPIALGQPVDRNVERSNLASTGAPAPIVERALNLPDLNALPPTAAGPVNLVGFPVERVTLAEAIRVSDAGSAFVIGGHRLFVYHGIPDMLLTSDGSGSVRIPQDAFAHTDPTAVVQLEARYLNGLPLPSWLKFEGAGGTFRGIPPEGLRGSLEIEVIARDSEGREAHSRFSLELADLQSADGRPVEVQDLPLGLDVDAKEKEKARLEAQRQAAKAKAGTDPKAGKQPAASFTDQLRTAKAPKDPLLDRITGSGSTPPRDRR